MSAQPTPRTPGATRAAPGEYVFDLASLQKIMGGPDIIRPRMGRALRATA